MRHALHAPAPTRRYRHGQPSRPSDYRRTPTATNDAAQGFGSERTFERWFRGRRIITALVVRRLITVEQADECFKTAVKEATRSNGTVNVSKYLRYITEFAEDNGLWAAVTNTTDQTQTAVADAGGWVVRIHADGGSDFTLYRDGATFATRDDARAAVHAELKRMPQNYLAVQI